MDTTAYYNEIDPYCVAWLENLIAAGHIAPGVVDSRDINDVTPNDLREFTQCHFFAGIGVWSYALRLAGWQDDRPAWSGSCPCQPFSTAGQGAGFTDERHLWPAFEWLINQCRPAIVFGEQVANYDANFWIDLVQADLEAMGYAVGAVPLPAASVGAPHIRDRLWWVGISPRRAITGNDVRLGDADGTGRNGHGRHTATVRWPTETRPVTTTSALVPMGNHHSPGRPGPLHGFWQNADWLLCRDDKWRPVESGTCPLADGFTGRVDQLRAYGNSIVAPLAAEFIRAVMDCQP